MFENFAVVKLKLAKITKRGVLTRSGGLENFSEINKRGGRLLGTKEYPILLETA